MFDLLMRFSPGSFLGLTVIPPPRDLNLFTVIVRNHGITFFIRFAPLNSRPDTLLKFSKSPSFGRGSFDYTVAPDPLGSVLPFPDERLNQERTFPTMAALQDFFPAPASQLPHNSRNPREKTPKQRKYPQSRPHSSFSASVSLP